MRNRPRLRQERWQVTCGLVLIYTLVHHVASNGSTSHIPGNNNVPSSGEKTTEGSVSDSVKNTATHPTTPAHHARVPTLRPRRQNCTPPAIEQFPMPLMGPEARKSGGLILHVLVAVYTFLGLAIVCDDYFVSSLDRICEGSRNYKKVLLCCSHRKKSPMDGGNDCAQGFTLSAC